MRDLQNIVDAYPLTSVQQGMLYHCLECTDTDVYVSYIEFDISGTLDAERFRRAWSCVIERHAMLRARIQWEGLEEPLVVVNASSDTPWTSHDWSMDTNDIRKRKFLELQRTERDNTITPSDKTLHRLNLVRSGENRWRLLWSIHHLLADGWSTPIILNEVMQCYDNGGVLPVEFSTPFDYSQYGTWLNNCDSNSAGTHWAALLTDAKNPEIRLPEPELNTDYDHLDDQVSFSFTQEQTQQLHSMCRECGVTLSTFMHGMWALLLQHYTGSEQVLFGTTSSGRQNDLPLIDSAVGLFLNTLPLSVTPEDESSLSQWLKQLQIQIQHGVSFDYTPLSEALGCLAAEVNNTLESIVVMESHQNDWVLQSNDSSVRFENITYTTHSNFPLALLVYPGSTLGVTLVHNVKLFSGQQISTLMAHFTGLIMSAVANPTIILKDLTSYWRQSIFYDHETEYRGNTTQTNQLETMHGWLDRVCRNSSDTIALIFAGQALTYRELNARANQIANLLKQEANGADDYVGIYFDRGINQIIAMIGVLKAGFGYLPLDPAYPSERIKKMCESAKVNSVLCGKGNPGITNVSIINIAKAATLPTESVEVSGEKSAAYLMYTSGSTGDAKGVMVSHRNLVQSTRARIRQYQLQAGRFILLSSYSFDSSVVGIYGTLCSGGTLVLPEQGQEKDIEAIVELVQKYKVTDTLCLASLYQLMLQSEHSGKLSSLQRVIVAGETCPTDLPGLHRSVIPKAALYNEYGPTEGTVWSHFCRIDSPELDLQNGVPIGSVIDNSIAFAVDNRGYACLPGVEGQLVISGPGVSEGYYQQALQSSRSFVDIADFTDSDTFISDYQAYLTGDLGYLGYDGLFRFSGRVDRQLKVRGYRIEPAEIESLISQQDIVNEVVVSTVEVVQKLENETSLDLQTTITTALENLDPEVARSLLEKAESMSGILVKRG